MSVGPSPATEGVSPTGTLDAFFRPRSLAVIGASRDPRKWGRRVLEYTRKRGFEGGLYGVNPAAPGYEGVAGVTFVSDLAEIPEPVDLVVVALPATRTPEAVASCVEAGVRGVVVAASGFGERSGAGKALEEEVLATTAKAGIRVLGPNGFGLFVDSARINLTPYDDIPSGPVALATQSGNVAIALFGEGTRAGVGFCSCVGLGNQIDVSIGEVLAYLAAEETSRIVACYVEGLRPGRGGDLQDGLAACRDAGKPVVVLKAGRSAQGATAASTHTGSLAADDRVWQAALDAADARRVASTQEMVDVLAALSTIPPSRGRVMVLTNGGGDSVMATDSLVESGLALARPRPQTMAALEALTPPDAPRVPAGNPVTLDTAGGVDEDPQLLARCVRAVAGDPNVDVVLIAGVFGGYHHLREQELACVDDLLAARTEGVTMVMQSAYADAGEEPLERLRRGGVPVYPTVQRLVGALVRTVRTVEAVEPATTVPDRASTGSGTPSVLLEIGATAELLARYGIALPALDVVPDRAALAGAAQRVRYPACVKLAEPAVAHKSDVGGVRLNISGPAEATRVAEELWQGFPGAPLLFMPMLEPGLELLAGTSTDPLFGPVVLVGRGGLWTELEADVALRLAPVTPAGAEEMVRRLRCSPMLLGARGQAPLDIAALAEVVSSLSRLAVDHPELSVEMNPLFLYQHGYAVADLRASRGPLQPVMTTEVDAGTS